MNNSIFVGDIIEGNGRTWKQNNFKKPHNIPLGTLVEINNPELEEFHGMRLLVVKHTRDCDGTPLYSLSFDKSLINYKPLDPDSNYTPEDKLTEIIDSEKILGGFDEEDLSIINK
ncbi:MAG: hypothetical protein ACOCP4_00655 [Candidatus Woesearchaeota archaeon]